MKVEDLTHYISDDMPVFPGTEPPSVIKANTLEADGFAEAKITLYSHTGTHIDAPAHMLKGAKTLDQLDIGHFVGKAMIIDVSGKNLQTIDLEWIKPYEDKIRNAEFVVLKTGWSQYWGSKKYFEGFPALSEAAARRLTTFKLKDIGIDAISIDAMDSVEFSVHKILLKSNIIIIENLTNLDSITNEYFTLSVMPLKTQNADGSPVRAYSCQELSSCQGDCQEDGSFDNIE